MNIKNKLRFFFSYFSVDINYLFCRKRYEIRKGGLGGDRPVTNAFLNYIRRENVKQVFFHLYWLVFYFQSIYKSFMRLDKKKSFHTINKIKKIIKILICLK